MLDAGLTNAGFIGLKTDVSFLGDGLVYFDWVRSRPYVEFEPKVEVKEGLRDKNELAKDN